jgi:transposase
VSRNKRPQTFWSAYLQGYTALRPLDDLARKALPEHFGSWQSVYHRHQRWRASGLWARILALLDDAEAQHVAA